MKATLLLLFISSASAGLVGFFRGSKKEATSTATALPTTEAVFAFAETEAEDFNVVSLLKPKLSVVPSDFMADFKGKEFDEKSKKAIKSMFDTFVEVEMDLSFMENRPSRFQVKPLILESLKLKLLKLKDSYLALPYSNDPDLKTEISEIQSKISLSLVNMEKLWTKLMKTKYEDDRNWNKFFAGEIKSFDAEKSSGRHKKALKYQAEFMKVFIFSLFHFRN